VRQALALFILAAALSGCALIERHETAATEQLLARAGFQMHAVAPGDSDLPPGEIVTRWEGKATLYLYADPDVCRCVYTGAMSQYERYRWLEARQNILRELNGDEMNAASLDDAP
jgi:hypothetical protein